MKGKKLLIIHQGALGDFITTFPALNLLRRQYRSIDAVCQKKLGRLAAYLGVIDSHFPTESAVMASVYSKSVHPKLHRLIQSYHTIILFSFSESMAESIEALSKARIYRIDPRPEPEERILVAAHLTAALTSAGAIPGVRDADADGSRLMAQTCDDPGYDGSRVILHPGSGSIRKNWPLPYFIRLAGLLKAEGKQPMFICGPAEQEMVPYLGTSAYPVSQIDDLIRLTASLRCAGGFIGNDSGVSHLSAYLGVPTLVIFGPSDPDRWRPQGRSVSIVKTDRGCRPCFETVKDRCRTPDCLNAVLPDRVSAAFFKLLGKSRFAEIADRR